MKTALESGYIRKVGQGFFDPTSDQKNQANTYAIHWEDSQEFDIRGAETAGDEQLEGDGSKRTPALKEHL